MMERKTRVYKGKKLENTFVVKSLILYLLYTGIFPSKTFSMRSIELLPVICVLIFVYPYCLVSFSFGMTVIKMLFDDQIPITITEF